MMVLKGHGLNEATSISFARPTVSFQVSSESNMAVSHSEVTLNGVAAQQHFVLRIVNNKESYFDCMGWYALTIQVNPSLNP